jgi:GH24 family phage-related lysozyme (muramidase)
MSDLAQPDKDIAADEKVLEQARGEREGLIWFNEEFPQEPNLEGPQLSIPPSATPISQRAFDLIVFFEVTSKQTYTQKYRKPIWPQGASGVTMGIGYDVGYASRAQLWDDWRGIIPDQMIQALERAIGVTGTPAKALASALGGVVDVDWEAAISVHRNRVMPRWIALVERSLKNTAAIGPHSLGALVSLTYNRGASFGKDGDRYREMRTIKEHMAAKTFDKISDDFRAMKRLWPNVQGLQLRRDREAQLFEDGLKTV